MKATAFFTKSEYVKGLYKETTLDEQKKNADFLLIAISDKYELFSNKGIELTGRGIKKSGKVYFVTETAYSKVAAKYNVMCDF